MSISSLKRPRHSGHGEWGHKCETIRHRAGLQSPEGKARSIKMPVRHWDPLKNLNHEADHMVPRKGIPHPDGSGQLTYGVSGRKGRAGHKMDGAGGKACGERRELRGPVHSLGEEQGETGPSRRPSQAHGGSHPGGSPGRPSSVRQVSQPGPCMARPLLRVSQLLLLTLCRRVDRGPPGFSTIGILRQSAGRVAFLLQPSLGRGVNCTAAPGEQLSLKVPVAGAKRQCTSGLQAGMGCFCCI